MKRNCRVPPPSRSVARAPRFTVSGAGPRSGPPRAVTIGLSGLTEVPVPAVTVIGLLAVTVSPLVSVAINRAL